MKPEVLLSTIIDNALSEKGRLIEVSNSIVIADVNSCTPEASLSFTNCQIVLYEDFSFSGLTINTSNDIRFENCHFELYLSIKSKHHYSVTDPENYFAPSIIFDNCTSGQFLITPNEGEEGVSWTPKLFITGIIGNCRIHFKDKGLSDLSFFQCHFNKLELQGHTGGLKLANYSGEEIFLRNMCCTSLWLREELLKNVKYVEIDSITVKNLNNTLKTYQVYDESNFRSFQMIHDLIRANRDSYKASLLNTGLCKYRLKQKMGFLKDLNI